MQSYESEPPVATAPKPKRKVSANAPDFKSNIPTEPVQVPTVSFTKLRLFGKHRNRRRQFKPATLQLSTPVIEQPDFNMEIKRIVEAILFAANRPMTARQVQQVFPELEQPGLQEIQAAIDAIIEEYRFRPVELKQVASGYRFQVKQELSRWVSRLFEEKPPKYSRALL
ncbi:MAG: SMC-Scp complex subunit ScpB, partial [Methylobacter sp.]